MFGFDENVCGKCGARRDDIGLGGCFCRDEERTMSEQKSFPTPAEYLALRKERVEREDREKAEAEQKRLADLDAKALVYAEKFLQTMPIRLPHPHAQGRLPSTARSRPTGRFHAAGPRT